MISAIQSILKSKIPAILWTIIIFILCTIPSDEASKIGSENDKINHAIAFAGFVFLWLFHTSFVKLIIGIGIFYGILIEIWQYILPESFHRGFELMDTVADAFGCIFGYLLFLLFSKILLKLNKANNES
jgi:VanZ family protein